MFKSLALASIILCVSSTVFAQTTKSPNKKFIIVSSFIAGATIYGAETTFVSMNKCPGCKAGNFFMQPFFESGRAATYGIEWFIDLELISSSYEMKKNKNKWWWVLPVAIGTAHVVTGSINLTKN